MTAEERTEEFAGLLAELLEQPRGQRQAWLLAHCPDPALQARLREALAAADRPTSDLLGPGPQLAQGGNSGFRPDSVIGAYRLIERLGEGGMGEVWRACRADGSLSREVALKLPRLALLAPGEDRRLGREAELLARLEHPYIARLYDAGRDDSGQVYLALELVEGQDLISHCRSRSLDLRGRLRLFLQVLAAVQFAHGRLVIHRDLKPANILVTPEGEVRLLDFGIAQLLATDAQGEPTVIADRALSPQYAAPEQWRGEAASTGTDVYALGLILYELLVDAPAFAFSSAEALGRTSAEDRPPPLPSQGLDRRRSASLGGEAPRRWRARLRGDLDAIVSHCLQTEPARRYASAQALADELRRHLDHQPIEARRTGNLQRLWLGARRQPLLSAMALALLLLISGALAHSQWQNQRIVQAAENARQAALRQQLISDFLTEDLLALANPKRGGGESLSVRALVDLAAARASLRLQDSPDLAAPLHGSLARVYEAIGDSAAAREQAQLGLAAATRSADGAPDTQLQLQLLLARIAFERDESEVLLPQLSRLEALDETPPTRRWTRALRAAHRYRRGDFRVASEGLQEVLDELESDPWQAPELYAFVSEQLGISLSNEGRMDTALGVVERVHQFHVERFGAEDPRSLMAARMVGALLRETGQLDQSEALLTDLLPALDRQMGAEHEQALLARFELARTLFMAKRLDRAIPLLETCAAGFAAVYPATHEFNLTTLNLLANAFERGDQTERAIPLHLELAELAAERYGPLHPHSLIYRSNAARAEMMAGRLIAAEQRLAPLLEDAASVLADDAFQLGYIFSTAGRIRLAQGREPAAREFLNRALEIFSATFGPDSTQAQRVHQQLADAGLADGAP